MKKTIIWVGVVLVLLAIIVILLVNFASTDEVLSNTRAKARDAARVSDVRFLAVAAELYYIDNDINPIIDDQRELNLIAGSDDYRSLQELLGPTINDDSMLIPIDPADPDRYYIFSSNEDTFYVKTYLEHETLGCKMLRENYCEFIVTKESLK